MLSRHTKKFIMEKIIVETAVNIVKALLFCSRIKDITNVRMDASNNRMILNISNLPSASIIRLIIALSFNYIKKNKVEKN